MTETRTKDIEQLLSNGKGFCHPQFSPSPALSNYFFNHSKVLIVGAGGLGCEILKNLALAGLKELHVIDLDSIDITNLNRQFLFRKKDVGRHKSEVAAEFMKRKAPDCDIVAHVGRI